MLNYGYVVFYLAVFFIEMCSVFHWNYVPLSGWITLFHRDKNVYSLLESSFVWTQKIIPGRIAWAASDLTINVFQDAVIF